MRFAKHKIACSADEMTRVCHICYELFPDQNARRMHMESHARFQCDECGFR